VPQGPQNFDLTHTPEQKKLFHQENPATSQTDYDKNYLAMKKEIEQAVRDGRTSLAAHLQTQMKEYVDNNPDYSKNHPPEDSDPFNDDANGRKPRWAPSGPPSGTPPTAPPPR
jgi:hypothetical protein